jgi:iron complex transport system permease protein
VKVRVVPAVAIATIALIASIAASLFAGPVTLAEAVANPAILRDLRLARALLAGVCGAALAGAGVVFQGLFRNPLADPFVMGVSGGAALGAVVLVAFKITAAGGLTAAAFAGGLAASWVAWRLARVRGRTPVESLVLAGFAVGAFCSATLAIVALTTVNNWDEVLRWLFGRCAHPDPWRPLAVAAPLTLVGLAAVAFHSRDLNVLATGEESAQQLGVDVDAAKARLLAAGTVLTAAAVAVCGIVGFVGLVVPHAARALVGPEHRRLLPVAVIGGAAALIAADTAARSVMPPHELPLGAVTAILGAPFFAVLLRRRRA